MIQEKYKNTRLKNTYRIFPKRIEKIVKYIFLLVFLATMTDSSDDELCEKQPRSSKVTAVASASNVPPASTTSASPRIRPTPKKTALAQVSTSQDEEDELMPTNDLMTSAGHKSSSRRSAGASAAAKAAAAVAKQNKRQSARKSRSKSKKSPVHSGAADLPSPPPPATAVNLRSPALRSPSLRSPALRAPNVSTPPVTSSAWGISSSSEDVDDDSKDLSYGVTSYKKSPSKRIKVNKTPQKNVEVIVC